MSNGTYQFRMFLEHKNLRHGVSSKFFGSMKQVDMLQIDRAALTKFAESAGITGDIVCMKQIHSGTVSIIENTNELQIPQTDGLVTSKKNIPLGVLTADCLPILFFDPKKEVIGVAHAGYKGLLNHIIENMISSFVTRFQSDPEDIIVGIGPGIEMLCYEVDSQRVVEFDEAFPTFKNVCSQMGGRFFFNLKKVALQCLVKEGILDEHIENMDVCTKCNSNFYSYRGKDGDNRFISIIELK